MPFRTTKTLLIFSVVLAGGSFMAYAGLWFFFITVRAHANENVLMLSADKRSRAADASLATLLSETAEKRAHLDALFVGNDATVSFLKELERVGNAAGVVPTVVKVGGAEGHEADSGTPAGVEKLTVVVEAEGDFAGVYRFLALLERLPRPLFMTNISVTHRDEKGKPAWSGTVETTVWKLK